MARMTERVSQADSRNIELRLELSITDRRIHVRIELQRGALYFQCFGDYLYWLSSVCLSKSSSRLCISYVEASSFELSRYCERHDQRKSASTLPFAD